MKRFSDSASKYSDSKYSAYGDSKWESVSVDEGAGSGAGSGHASRSRSGVGSGAGSGSNKSGTGSRSGIGSGVGFGSAYQIGVLPGGGGRRRSSVDKYIQFVIPSVDSRNRRNNDFYRYSSQNSGNSDKNSDKNGKSGKSTGDPSLFDVDADTNTDADHESSSIYEDSRVLGAKFSNALTGGSGHKVVPVVPIPVDDEYELQNMTNGNNWNAGNVGNVKSKPTTATAATATTLTETDADSTIGTETGISISVTAPDIAISPTTIHIPIHIPVSGPDGERRPTASAIPDLSTIVDVDVDNMEVFSR